MDLRIGIATTGCEYDEEDAVMASWTVPGSAQSGTSDDSGQRNIPSIRPSQPPPRARRRFAVRSAVTVQLFVLLVLAFLVPLSSAVFINFDNCLDPGYRDARDPKRLQFTPLHVWASFNTSAPSHRLNLTIWGNVSGQAVQGEYPAPNDPMWSDDTNLFGKIGNLSKANNKYSTLLSNFKVLTYTAFADEPRQFCPTVVNGKCPVAPSFNASPYDLDDLGLLPAFSVGHDFYSSYSFATFESTMKIISGESTSETLACVSANVTPDLGNALATALRYLPVAILALVGIATVFAANASPWGTYDIFRWTSNYGRDEDLLRLVTPGFGDCLQYIQFIVLAGSLNLQYPGFFQPVVSQASWSVLLFNSSLVSHGNGTQSLIDGVYFANGTYGLSRLGEYVGMSEEQDIWAGMAVWLLGVIAAVTLITQLAFAANWAYRAFTDKSGEHLAGKNWPFTAGNVVRIVFNFFMLPIISLSLFQLVVAPRSPASVVATAVILLIAVMGIAAWIFWLIFTTRPRAHLFDDLPTVLAIGPLYNTYSDDAAPFAFIPVLLTVIRGIAIGAIQPSGIAQIIILAICEVILILTLHAFRPFQSNTSMNAYHTFFSAIRLGTVLLMIAFVPTLGVMESQKGWIGYAILLMHAIVLVFGFFLNSLQTLIEVTARLCGAGVDQRGGLTKVFGKRQLSRRSRRQRSSLNSDAAMLGPEVDKPSAQLMNGRARSLSGSSAILLGQPYGGPGSQRASAGFDQFSQGGDISHGGTTPGTPATNIMPWSQLGGASGQSSRRPTMGGPLDNAEHYYRPPRQRKQTLDSLSNVPPGIGGRGPSTDLENTPYADNIDQAEIGDGGEGPSSWSPSRSSITPAYLRMQRDDSDPALAERRKNTDYSFRESDLYYNPGAHGRGPSLSAQPTRKLKTGPADPMGPVSSATGWLKGLSLFGAKKKEKSKGFEVVRSTRLPPQMMPLDEEEDESPTIPQEPYRDSPEATHARGSPVAGMAGTRRSDDASDKSSDRGSYHDREDRVPEKAPTLGPIDAGGGIELPSRIGSRASRVQQEHVARAPSIPRKSSRRTRSTDAAVLAESSRLSTVLDTPNREAPPGPIHLHPHSTAMPLRLPFGSTEPSPSPERTPGQSESSSMYHDTSPGQFYSEDILNRPPTIQAGDERPLSTGYVHQHVARDSIQNDEARTHLEASAEFVDRSRSVSTQKSGGSYRAAR